MTPQEANALIAEGAGIDLGAQAHAEAAATGNLDDQGRILPAPSPEDELNRKAENWVMLPQVIAWAITTVFPETKPHYSEAACMDLARKIVPVADKYGLDGIEASPELMLGIGTAMFCMPGYMAFKKRKAVQAQEDKERRDRGETLAPVELEPTKPEPANGG